MHSQLHNNECMACVYNASLNRNGCVASKAYCKYRTDALYVYLSNRANTRTNVLIHSIPAIYKSVDFVGDAIDVEIVFFIIRQYVVASSVDISACTIYISIAHITSIIWCGDANHMLCILWFNLPVSEIICNTSKQYSEAPQAGRSCVVGKTMQFVFFFVSFSLLIENYYQDSYHFRGAVCFEICAEVD